MTAEQMSAFLDGEAATVKIPYLIIGIVVLVVAVLLYKSKLPEITEAGHDIELPTGSQSIMRHKHLVWGIAAQFFYVGAQVCVSSFFIRYLGKTANIDEITASRLLGAALFCFMIGRFIGTFLMRYISPNILLALYALINVVLLIVVVIYGGMLSVYALIGVEFFMSIMFPTIFSLSIKSLGKETKIGSSLVIMSIVGGAIFPLIMGRISDMMSIQVAYSVPLVCFFVVFYFGWKGSEVKSQS